MLSSDHRIQMLEELDRLQVLISAVLVRDPLAVAASVIQIQDRCDSVYTKSVNVELLDPEQGVADQEILDLALAEVEYLGSPVRMLALARIRILIACRSVKIRKSVRSNRSPDSPRIRRTDAPQCPSAQYAYIPFSSDNL